MRRFTVFPLALAALAALVPPLAAQHADGAPRITMAEFKKLQAENKVLVVDVRDAQSFATGHIPGARSIPLASLAEPARVAELKAATKEIVLYCA
jgi:rhodanese-related sulfurtransferase